MMQLNITKLNLLLLASLTSVLVGCGNDGGDDLDKFMASSGTDMSKGVEPLPEVLPYIPLQ